jgi:hypothetical protein
MNARISFAAAALAATLALPTASQADGLRHVDKAMMDMHKSVMKAMGDTRDRLVGMFKHREAAAPAPMKAKKKAAKKVAAKPMK